MSPTVNVSDRTKFILEGIKHRYGYKSLDTAIRKALDESNINEDTMFLIGQHKDKFDISEYISNSSVEEATDESDLHLEELRNRLDMNNDEWKDE